MTTKKKTSPLATKTVAAPKGAAAAPGQLSAPKQPSVPQAPTAAEQQLTTWGAAVQLFTQQKFKEACELFTEAAKGPAVHIADKARSYLQICQRKVSKPAFDFRTAEDHFNYGVERLNARDFEQARAQFGEALQMQPEGDHIFYTLALCCGLSGDGEGACENLKRAIDLEPRNRVMARQDPEFAALAAHSPELRSLLTTEPAPAF